MEPELTTLSHGLTDDSVDQMLVLAERLRAANGGVLDDSAIQAVSEATGAPSDYVRLAVKLRTENQRKSTVAALRAQFLTLEPDVRRYVVAGVAATACGLLSVLESVTSSRDSSYGVFGMLGLVALTGGLYNICVARESRTAATAGAILGGGFFATSAVFAAILRMENVHIESFLLIPYTLCGALGGMVLHRIVAQYRSKLGLKDPVKERQQLLQQLVELQDRLRSGEQSITFLSVDIVGSTRMKERSDPLSIEFTFNEYHQFVERVTRKYGGRVHSTAGDGMTCAFDNPAQAFNAARNVQAGILELNTFRNKVGVPIVLRCGVHTGNVVTPQAGDIKSVNFAHVIDIAAHLQKTAPPGGIVVSDASAALMPGGRAAIGTQRVEAMNVEGTAWLPRPIAPAGPGATPPAVPENVP